MKTITAKTEKRNIGNIIVLYADGKPIGNFYFEEKPFSSAILRFMYKGEMKPRKVVFIGATPQSIFERKEFIGRNILKGAYS